MFAYFSLVQFRFRCILKYVLRLCSVEAVNFVLSLLTLVRHVFVTKYFYKPKMNIKFWKQIRLSDDLTALQRLILFISEFIATTLLMFGACLCSANEGILGPRRLVTAAIGVGLVVMIAIFCFGHISGSHINPSISIAAMILGVIPLIEMPIYFCGQFLGAIAGYGLVLILLPYMYNFWEPHIDEGLCGIGLNPDVTPMQGFIIEIIITAILVAVVCGVWDSRNVNKMENVAVTFGFTVAVLVIAAGPFSGAHMNPARTLGPSLLNNYWKNSWIYWIGPPLGSLLAAIFYSIVFNENNTKHG